MTGQRLILVFLASSALLVLAWLAPPRPEPRPGTPPDADRRLCARPPASGVDLVALGDSITAGHRGGPGQPAQGSWLDHAACGDRRLVGAVNAGVPGETTAGLRRRVRRDVLRWRPGMCVVLGGTNDLLRSRPVADTIEDLTAIVGQLRDGAVVPVLATVPPVDGRGFDVSRLNAAIAGLARAEGLAVVDFHAVLAGGDGRFRAGLSYDGVHPTAQGARLMGRAATPVLGEVTG